MIPDERDEAVVQHCLHQEPSRISRNVSSIVIEVSVWTGLLYHRLLMVIECDSFH